MNAPITHLSTPLTGLSLDSAFHPFSIAKGRLAGWPAQKILLAHTTQMQAN